MDDCPERSPLLRVRRLPPRCDAPCHPRRRQRQARGRAAEGFRRGPLLRPASRPDPVESGTAREAVARARRRGERTHASDLAPADALGEARGENRYIATVPRRGYCFVATVLQLAKVTDIPSTHDRTVAVLSFDNWSGAARRMTYLRRESPRASCIAWPASRESSSWHRHRHSRCAGCISMHARSAAGSMRDT